MLKNRLYILISVLVLAAVACYSDSSLWPYELTPAPPTPTPLPTPLPEQARLHRGDLAWAPASVTEAAFRLDLTTVPQPLKADLSNKSPQSCSQNSLVRVLHNAITETGVIYTLIDCSGVAGWTLEDRLLGPLTLVAGDRALTTEDGTDEFGAYKVEISDPPYREDDPFRQKADCKVNDTVDVIAVTGFSTGELYYKIRCTHPFNPVAQNVGWATAEGLFGPVRFRNGERAILPQQTASIELTAAPDDDEVVAMCEQGETITITDTPVQRIDESLYYELQCEAGTGWALQDLLVGPVSFEEGENVLVTVPGVTNSAEAKAASQVSEEEVAEEIPPEETDSILPSVPLTNAPGPLLTDNQVGQCADATITPILDFAGVEDVLYAQVECDSVAGWLDSDVLFGPVEYHIGETVLLGEDALIGFNQRGIFLSIELFDIEGPSGGSSVIAGECAIDFDTFDPIETQLVDVGYYRSSTGSIVGVFYRAQCQNEAGQTIEGWINQDRIGVEG